MSVVYEPRNFLHDGSYPAINDHDHGHPGHDHDHSHNYGSPDLTAYNLGGSLSGDDRSMLPDELTSDDVIVTEALSLQNAALPCLPNGLSDPLPEVNTPPEKEEDQPDTAMNGGNARSKCIPKPDREVQKGADGKFYCSVEGCVEGALGFARRCEWSKHMDKHERPYRCTADGCEKLPGFTYSGGLLRHEREVHGKHGGPKNTVNCPHPTCKRHTGKGFSRQENLNEHLRRVHTGDGATPAADDVVTSDGDSEKAGTKRKRSRKNSPEDYDDIREEIKRLREENSTLQNEKSSLLTENTNLQTENSSLRQQMDQQSRQCLSIMAQFAELQHAMRNGDTGDVLGDSTGLGIDSNGINAPPAPMM